MIELFEAVPAHYLAAAARQHRWARGDWQLLPWILGERLSLIGRWKVVFKTGPGLYQIKISLFKPGCMEQVIEDTTKSMKELEAAHG